MPVTQTEATAEINEILNPADSPEVVATGKFSNKVPIAVRIKNEVTTMRAARNLEMFRLRSLERQN